MKLMRIGVVSAGKVCAVVFGILMTIVGILNLILMSVVFSLLGTAIDASSNVGGGDLLAGFGFVGLLIALVVMIIMGVIGGFIWGVILASLYNFAAKILGGLDIEIE